jgi:formyltetrahydrofolate deformylase
MNPRFILTIRCRDTLGIVAAVASSLAAAEAFITESSHFGDEDTGWFFMRTVFRPTGTRFRTQDDFAKAMAPVAQRFDAELVLCPADENMKVLLAVSKHGHCLNTLLNQWHAGELPVDVVGVVSNHDDMRRMVDWYGIPYHHLPMNDDKAAQEARFLRLIADS